MVLWPTYSSTASLPWHSLCCFGFFYRLVLFSLFSSKLWFWGANSCALVSLCVPLCPPDTTFSAFQSLFLLFFFFFSSLKLRKIRNLKMYPGNIPLPISSCFLSWVKLLFSTVLQSCKLHLCSLFTESSRGRGTVRGWRAEGKHTPFSSALTQRSASLSLSRTRPWERDSPTVTMSYTNITSI